MLVTLLVTLILVLFCVVLLATGIILRRNGTFPSRHVGDNPALRDKGIKCATAQDHEQRLRKNLNEIIKV